MALFGKQDPAQAEAARADREDQQRLAQGGLPLGAETRLRELRGKPFFTSSLSVNEFALAATEGVRPLGQVMGSTIYHVGWQYTPIYQSTEMVTLSHAQYQARHLALSRLQQEARLLGAHGVIGVRLIRKSHEWGENLIEFTAQGTAVALADGPVPEHPFVCALSGQDFYALRRGGFFPVGFAFGTCTYYQVASYSTQWAGQGGFFGGGAMQNMELTDYTQAAYIARHAATSRLTDEARQVRAEGVVGMTIQDNIRIYEVEINKQQRRDLIVDFAAYGTAIVSTGSDVPAIEYALPVG